MVALADDSVGSAVDVIAAVARGRRTAIGCVVGKGPSFERFNSRPLNSIVLAVNQAALTAGEATDFAVVTDSDVLTDEYFTALPPTCGLILPVYPHVNFRPHREVSLPVLTDRFGPLRKLAVDGRLFTYRSDRWPESWPGPSGPGWPRLRVRAFTAVACVALLAAAGIRTVVTAGVDGGKDYHRTFTTQGLTPLSNGRNSFDSQFREFDRFRKRGVTITAL